MNPDLVKYLLEKIAEEPAGRRVLLYRALAAETSDKLLATNCRTVANLLENVERNHQQLLLDFKRRTVA